MSPVPTEPNAHETFCLTFKLNQKRLTRPAMGVGSRLTLLIRPGLILLIRLQTKEREGWHQGEEEEEEEGEVKALGRRLVWSH